MKKQQIISQPLILNGISFEQFKELFQEVMYESLGYKPEIEQIKIGELDKLKKVKDSSVYLTRGEVAKQLQISLPTLHNYSKEGWIKSYRIGGKVRYKAEDIEEALTERNFTAVNRRGGINAAA